MSIKTFSIITIIIFLITLGLLSALFFVSNQPPQEPGKPGNQETGEEPAPPFIGEEPREEPEKKREPQEFDETLFRADGAVAPSESQAERAAVEVFIRSFIEDYGSFSTAGGYAHIEAYYPKMTRSMREFVEQWIAENPAQQKSSAFYSIQTSVANIRFDAFEDDRATVFVETSRVETDVPEYYNNSKKQDVEVKLVREDGEWMVRGVYLK